MWHTKTKVKKGWQASKKSLCFDFTKYGITAGAAAELIITWQNELAEQAFVLPYSIWTYQFACNNEVSFHSSF